MSTTRRRMYAEGQVCAKSNKLLSSLRKIIIVAMPLKRMEKKKEKEVEEEKMENRLVHGSFYLWTWTLNKPLCAKPFKKLTVFMRIFVVLNDGKHEKRVDSRRRKNVIERIVMNCPRQRFKCFIFQFISLVDCCAVDSMRRQYSNSIVLREHRPFIDEWSIILTLGAARTRIDFN